MPINVVSGSTVGFTVAFFSTASGAAVTVVPSSATLTLTYPPSSNSIASVTTTIGMVLSGSYFTATWGSAVAALGMTSYSVSAPGQASPTTGLLRIIS